jgi:hypothetical protein
LSRGFVRAGLVATGLTLQACATVPPIVYGPIAPEQPHGFKDRPNADGGFTVLVVEPGHAKPEILRAYFYRRAAELCPGGVDHTTIFRMDRPDTVLRNYSNQPSVAQRIWIAAEVEGYVYCKAEAAKPAA